MLNECEIVERFIRHLIYDERAKEHWEWNSTFRWLIGGSLLLGCWMEVPLLSKTHRDNKGKNAGGMIAFWGF